MRYEGIPLSGTLCHLEARSDEAPEMKWRGLFNCRSLFKRDFFVMQVRHFDLAMHDLRLLIPNRGGC